MADSEEGKRSQFGSRFLTDPSSVFEHNAWDNVEWDDAQEETAKKSVENNSCTKLGPEAQLQYEVESDRYWNEFYAQHQNRFFKDRHWLFTEFPELAPLAPPELTLSSEERVTVSTTLASSNGTGDTNETDIEKQQRPDGVAIAEENVMNDALDDGGRRAEEEFPGQLAKTRMFEVGCGVGNTVFPVLQTNDDPDLFMYCCDLSENAIQLVKESRDYNVRRCHAFVCDVTDVDAHLPMPDASLDIVILIFVLSAVNPEKMKFVLARLSRLLKPGGRLMFRDYGRYDLTQLRFKKGRCLGDNFYVRGDGTKVYFFTQEELRELFTGAGLVEEQNLIDRRLQVNRGRQLKMYRVWIQCKYRKPLDTAADLSQTVDTGVDLSKTVDTGVDLSKTVHTAVDLSKIVDTGTDRHAHLDTVGCPSTSLGTGDLNNSPNAQIS